jgi:hypothetical protein
MPDLDRLVRAVHLDAERLANGAWCVSGGEREHVVSADAKLCDCADFTIRAVECKHMLAVRLRLGDADVIRTLRLVVPAGRPVRRIA